MQLAEMNFKNKNFEYLLGSQINQSEVFYKQVFLKNFA